MLGMYRLLALSFLLACGAEFADHLQTHKQECLGEGKFICMDQGCIDQEQYCDGYMDCADGSDESFCPEHPPDELACNAAHQFLCRDGQACVPATWVCNGAPDCGDASDEANCTSAFLLPKSAAATECKGFTCDDGKCISGFWVCDGRYDCKDHTDEDIEKACRHALKPHSVADALSCDEFDVLDVQRRYKCLDDSFCVPSEQICDGLMDCRDGSDEGPWCDKWHTMCDNTTCPANMTYCVPDRAGPRCVCRLHPTMKLYNATTKQCDDIDDCLAERPRCSHICHNKDGHFICRCDEGYIEDTYQYLCFTPAPEAMLFFSTQTDIRYLKVKSKQEVTVATGIKQGHGVSYDGKYLYWVETAEGHQAIMRAHLENVPETKETLVSIGLEDPGDVAVDWSAGNIYFTDSERGTISVCKSDGFVCTTLKTDAKRPRFVTLDVRNGTMYWADHHSKEVIMRARMDGSQPEVLVDTLRSFASGLALDVPNGRLYFVDVTIRVVKVDTKQVYSLFEERFHHPYAISVFENTVFWSDWTSNTVQATDKLHPTSQNRNVLATLHGPVFDMHIYHPVLMNKTSSPCDSHNCSHLCLLSTNTTFTCACPDGMQLNGSTCYNAQNYRFPYLVVGGGAFFTRIQYDTLGNPETHATNFDIGRVQAMAYDSRRDVLYAYDAVRKAINSINMTEFTLGITHMFAYKGLENVADMDYDYVTDNLYVLDAGRRFLEVFSLRNDKRALVYRFTDQEIPISLCVLPDYGRLLVAVIESEQSNEIHIDSIGLHGEDRQHRILNDLKGPHVTLRYAHNLDNVYMSDESSGTIDYIHPGGAGRENYVRLLTTVTSLSVTDTLIFWTDNRTPRLFWADVHETKPRVRRLELSIFPNDTHLYIQANTQPSVLTGPMSVHPCVFNPCSDICVQTPHPTPLQDPSHNYSFRCLCPTGLTLEGNNCSKLVSCLWEELYCHRSNECVPWAKKCDGKNDCTKGEDEEFCPVVAPSTSPSKCLPNQIVCKDGCIGKDEICSKDIDESSSACELHQFECRGSNLCIEHSQVCDKQPDCPDGSDEDLAACDTLRCYPTEFMCASGSCILNNWRCDGDSDCNDGSDEINCVNLTCGRNFYQCRSGQCVELSRRCDSVPDCVDGSDEEHCREDPPIPQVLPPSCGEGEYGCELNESICVPFTTRCNSVIDCPGGTDESGCEFHCGEHGLFACKQQQVCVGMRKVCNGHNDCLDGSDETPEACKRVNRTSRLFPAHPYPPAACHNGFLCRTGQCVEWREVCDEMPHCFDGSDEGGKCFTACENSTCTFKCQPTPMGPQCTCPEGFELAADQRGCVDVDECARDVCAQRCWNTAGSFLCSCRHGYALRSDRRSCKATKGSMSILYVAGYSVRSVSFHDIGGVEYEDRGNDSISDLDLNIGQNTFYVTLPEAGKLMEINGTDGNVAITNVGKPSKVAVEWVTGNVYFVDSSPGSSCIRVCNFQKQRCAKLHKLPAGAEVKSLVVSPETLRLYFCMDGGSGSTVIWGGQLSGLKGTDLSVEHCAGLAVDGDRLYVAGRSELWRVDAQLTKSLKIITSDKHLQSPSSSVVFEDYVYVLSDSYKINRCLTFGQRTCDPYIFRLFKQAQTFVVRHSSMQRDDLKNDCEGFVCANVCVLGERGPMCVCHEGDISKDGSCVLFDRTALPLFNGWMSKDFVEGHRLSVTLVSVTLLLFALYIGVFFYYHCLYRRSRGLALPVRFQNQASTSGSSSSTPIIEMAADSTSTHDFVNPLVEFWRRSFRSQRPVGTAGLNIEILKPPQDLSDTESDMDYKQDELLPR